jgi:nucleoside-diphosphate-sugar epimerase
VSKEAILVTGCAGFIGAAITQELAEITGGAAAIS